MFVKLEGSRSSPKCLPKLYIPIDKPKQSAHLHKSLDKFSHVCYDVYWRISCTHVIGICVLLELRPFTRASKIRVTPIAYISQLIGRKSKKRGATSVGFATDATLRYVADESEINQSPCCVPKAAWTSSRTLFEIDIIQPWPVSHSRPLMRLRQFERETLFYYRIIFSLLISQVYRSWLIYTDVYGLTVINAVLGRSSHGSLNCIIHVASMVLSGERDAAIRGL